MKILIIELSNVGDAILTYPALGALWETYPNAEFHVLAGPRTERLFSGDPRIARVWVWEKNVFFVRQMVLIARLALQRFQWVIDFRHSLIPIFLFAHRTPLIRKRNRHLSHRAEEHFALLKSLGMTLRPREFPLPYGPEEEMQVREWLHLTREEGLTPKIVVISPGALSHLKRWPAQRFARVADRLAEAERVKFFLVGDGEDLPVAQEVQAAMQHSVTNLVGRTTLRELAALLAKADLLITNDSACLHAAEAMGTASVAIFGPTDEKKYGPRHPRSIVVRRALVCAPCERALCPYNHECLQQLGADEVFAAALKILQN